MTSLSTNDFATFYSTLAHYSIKGKLLDMIEWTFHREGSLNPASNKRQGAFTDQNGINFSRVRCTKLYKQSVGIKVFQEILCCFFLIVNTLNLLQYIICVCTRYFDVLLNTVSSFIKAMVN